MQNLHKWWGIPGAPNPYQATIQNEGLFCWKYVSHHKSFCGAIRICDKTNLHFEWLQDMDLGSRLLFLLRIVIL